jgi:hypothetical protein
MSITGHFFALVDDNTDIGKEKSRKQNSPPFKWWAIKANPIAPRVLPS